MGINVPIWSPPVGDRNLTAALLAQISGNGSSGSYITTAITTAGDGVLTAAALTGGQIGRTGPTAAYTDTTATAALIVTALGGFVSGQSFVVRIKNATKFTQTLAAGTGVTLPTVGAVIQPMSVGAYFGTVGGSAASPTVTFTHISTGPIYVSQGSANASAAAVVTVGAATLTAAQVAGGVVNRGGTQIAAFTDTTPTADLLIAGVPSLTAVVGSSVEWTYVNNTIFPATIAAGSGVTLSPTSIIIPANSWAKFVVTYTAASAVTFLLTEQGYFPKTGTFANNGTSPVTITDSAITANSSVTITLKTVGGTVGAIPHLATVTPGTGFTTIGTASDTSTYTYEIRG